MTIQQSAFAKLDTMLHGQSVIMSDDELDNLANFDASNVVRSKPNTKRVGTKDTYECWIERRDVKRIKQSMS